MREGEEGMLKYFGRTRRLPIALDIGTDSVKMLQLRLEGGSPVVAASARRPLPEPAAGGEQERRRSVVQAVREMLRTGGFAGRNVVSALSAECLKIKNVRLPQMREEKLIEAARWEARERFGCDFAPDQLFFLPAGQVRQGAESYQEIILLGAEAGTVEQHLELLSEANLRPLHIDAEPLALFRPFARRLRRQSDGGTALAVVDLGHSSTKVIIARGRQIVLIKRIDLGGRRFTEAVAKQLGLSVEEAR
ncbi:MAG: pilus assembly protein PilM, partial [Planctomycetes bacterium]|nr:pilus assembly protein PilM [Planctomycetota bacterium]